MIIDFDLIVFIALNLLHIFTSRVLTFFFFLRIRLKCTKSNYLTVHTVYVEHSYLVDKVTGILRGKSRNESLFQ